MKTTSEMTPKKKQSQESSRQRIGGLSARALSAFAVAFSFSFWLEAGLSSGLSYGKILLFCALGCFVTCLMLLPPWGTVGGGLCVIGAGVGGYLFFRGRFQVIGYALSAFGNACSRVLFGKNAALFSLPDRALRDLDLGEEDCFRIGMVFAVILLSAFFTLCLFRKVHPIPLLIVSLGLLTVEISFGMPVSVLSFLLCCSSLAGSFALFHADRAARKQKEKDRAVQDGFSGLFTILLTFLFLLLPASLIKKPMRQLPSVPVFEEKAGDFLDRLFSGKIKLFDSDHEKKSFTEKRDTYAEERNPDDDKRYEIRLAVETPVYLREWVGKNFSDDAWVLPTDEEREAFFEVFGRGFSSELLTVEFLRALDPALIELGPSMTSVSYTDLGYSLARVSVKNLTGERTLAGLPSFVDPSAGVIGESDAGAQFYAYCDGVFRWPEGSQTSSYTVDARLTRTKGRAFGKQLSEQLREAEEQLAYIRRFRRNGIAPSDGYQSLSDEEKERYDLDSFLGRYCNAMDRYEQSHVMAVIDNLALYDDYVYENYLSLCTGAHEIESLAKQILRRDKSLGSSADLTDPELRDLAVHSVIGYLSSNMAYTLSPRRSSENYLNSVHEFLFESKEGYCVQFASAATMLLRSLGIPTRYCEGYFTTSFSEAPTAGREGKYSAVMTGKNAHAWIEVYFDGFGWITYEATKPFVSYVSDLPGAETAPETDRFGESRPETKPKNPDETEAQTAPESKRTTIETRSPEDTITKTDSVLPQILALLLIAGGLIAGGFFLQRSADTAEKKLKDLLGFASDREKTSSLTPPERSALAGKLTGLLFLMFAYAGSKPSVGEQPSDFLARAWGEIGETGIEPGVTEAVLSGDFNPNPSPEELSTLSDAVTKSLSAVTGRCGKRKAFRLRYFTLPGYFRKSDLPGNMIRNRKAD